MLGLVLGVMARCERPGTKVRTLMLMAVRLVLFVTAAAWASRQFGPSAGVAVLIGAIASRALLMRARPAP